MDKLKSLGKFFLITFVFLIILGSITLPFSFNGSNEPFADRSYSIPQATVDLFIQDTGNINVVENLEYSFKGKYNGVYRDIPLKSGEKISNINVTTDGAFSKINIYNTTKNGQNISHITVYLYSDAQKTTPITDKNVKVTFTYNMINVTKIYDDTAEVHFKVWGEDWQVPVGQLTTKVHLTSNDGVQYWLNPPYYVTSSGWEGSVLYIVTGSIQPGNFFEIRLAIPKNQFTNPIYAQQMGGNGLANIQNIQTAYQNELNTKQTIYSLITIILLILSLIPLFIYFKYGREPKTTYQGKYERDPPADDPPAVVNALFGSSDGIGEPGKEGFQTTVMDLINRGYLLQEDETPKDNKKGLKSVNLKINSQKSLNSLHPFEMQVMDFFGSSNLYGLINLEQFGEGVKDQMMKATFRGYYLNWQQELKEEFLSKENMEKYFIKKGSKYFLYFGIIGVVISIIAYLVLFFLFDPMPIAYYTRISALILGISAIISFSLPDTVGGCWTQYGRDYNEKWKAFKKFLKDFSLIQEYPPESIIIWNKYLVYATALGVADEVKKAMEKILPEEELYKSSTYQFHDSGGYYALSTVITTSMYPSSSGSGSSGGGGSGGSGGAGGGSGGGGGGAF